MNTMSSGLRVLWILLMVVLSQSAVWAGEAKIDTKNMDSYDVTFAFDPAFREGPGISFHWFNMPPPPRKEEIFDVKTIKLYVPKSIKKGDVIRGVMSHRSRGFEEFAARNNIVFCDYDDGFAPYWS